MYLLASCYSPMTSPMTQYCVVGCQSRHEGRLKRFLHVFQGSETGEVLHYGSELLKLHEWLSGN